MSASKSASKIKVKNKLTSYKNLFKYKKVKNDERIMYENMVHDRDI
jgi:hypothetical protein